MRKKFHRSEPQEMFLKSSLKAATNDDDENSTPTKTSDIFRPHENDVLMGRGGKNNQHSGNEKLREIARERCDDYQVASKKGKSRISKELVEIVRTMDPPGRFLRRVNETSRWEDVGDDIAREKTSQVLRDAVAYQVFGPAAKNHRHKAATAENAVKSKRFEGEGKSGQPLMSPIIVGGASLPNKYLDNSSDPENREVRRQYSPMHTSSFVGSSAAFSPMWQQYQQRQRELRSDDHNFSPASSGRFVQQSFPPAYLGVMRDPASSSASSVFPKPQNFNLPSVTPASATPSTPASSVSARKRPRHFDSPMSPRYSTGFSSPQPYYSQMPVTNTPPLGTNSSPMMVTSTPPFTRNAPPFTGRNAPMATNTPPFARNTPTVTDTPQVSSNTSWQQYQNQTALTGADVFISPHDASHYRSPNNFPASYHPGARFATANSPGAFNYRQSPTARVVSSASSQNVGASGPWMRPGASSMGGGVAAEGSQAAPRGGSTMPTGLSSIAESFDARVDTDMPMGPSPEEFAFFEEEVLSDSERPISPFPFSIKLEDDTSRRRDSLPS